MSMLGLVMEGVKMSTPNFLMCNVEVTNFSCYYLEHVVVLKIGYYFDLLSLKLDQT